MAAEWQVLASGGAALRGLCLNPSGVMHAVCQESSDVYKVEVGTESGAPRAKMQVIARTDGAPAALAFDADGAMFTGDLAVKAVLSQPPDVDGFEELVTEHEGRLLRGPSSLAFARDDGTLFFTDSGPLGDTTLENPKGSVFMVSPDNSILTPLALECLAHPCSIAVSPDGTVVYVAEMLANRILRFVRRPGGLYQCSVFHQFSGLVGPSALCCDSLGRLYVGRFEYAGVGAKLPGSVMCLEPSGKICGELTCPCPEITSIQVDTDEDGGGDLVYVTEASSSVLYRIASHHIVNS